MDSTMTERDNEEDALGAYFDANPVHHETTERWPVQGELRVRLGIASTLPPARVSSSILAIVLSADHQVLFLHPTTPSGSISHVLIGGRPEGNETPEQTAIREVGEETGWRIEPIRVIGFRHFFHLEPYSPKSDRPYPDFVQPVFAARAIAFDPAIVVPGDRIPAEFIDCANAERLIEPSQRPLLRAAVSALQ
jgi:8-oxo-dGTP pyrophosphatase MutT (NUDIX family)